MNRNLWYGVLEAGEKSSPVVIDIGLTTKKADTVYVFNQSRNKILEYKRDIIDSKLRELSADESELINTLTAAYEQIREAFLPTHIKSPPLSYADDRGKAAITAIHADDDAIIEDDYEDFNDGADEEEDDT